MQIAMRAPIAGLTGGIFGGTLWGLSGALLGGGAGLVVVLALDSLTDTTHGTAAVVGDGGCRSCGRTKVSSRVVAADSRATPSSSSLFDLTHADSSRLGAVKDLILYEQHVVRAPCRDCMAKHAAAGAAYLDEAFTLRGGELGDSLLARVVDRELLGATAGPRALTVARSVRKTIARKIGLSS